MTARWRGSIFPVTLLFLACPLKKGLDCKLYRRKNQVQKTLRTGPPKEWLQGKWPEGRNLHIKMHLKSQSKIVLSFNTPISSLFTLLLHSNEATQVEWQEEAAPWPAGSPRRPAAGLCLRSPPSRSEQALFYLQSKSWLVWFVSLEPSIKEATFSCYVYLSTYQSGYFFWQLVAHRLTWPNGLMNACIQTAYCYQNGMWEYAMHLRLRNDQEIKI